MNETIYVTGHRNPDSDSICAAITYANMLKELGQQSTACRQGPLNEETKFILKRFHQDNPLLLTDARTMLADIDLDKPALISMNATVHHAWHVMLQTKNRSLFVMDEQNRLCGVCTTSNLSAYRLQEKQQTERLMALAELDDIAHTIGGTVAARPSSFSQNGRIHVITLEGRETAQYNLEGGISILSSGEEKQRLLIDQGVRCLVITCGVRVSSETIDYAVQKGCAVVETEEDTMHTAQVIGESYAIRHIMQGDVISFRDNEYMSDVAAKMTKSRVRSYPVLNADGEVVGAVSRYHTLNYPRRKFVLVDHSAVNQSILHVEDADLQAIVDHHHIGDITTDHPVNYRNVRCGCTCTIIAGLYQEHGLLPDKDMSGLLLSAILSDTLNLKSATTTDFDRMTVKWLAERAGIEDVDEYAREMLSASVDLKDSTPEDILNRDLKSYAIGKYHFAIGQTNYGRMDEVTLILPGFIRYLEKEQQDRGLDLLVMLFTDVMGKGSVFVYFGPLAYVIAGIIETNFNDHYGFDSRIISRKQQLMPMISDAIKNL